MAGIYQVTFSKNALRDLKKIPRRLTLKLQAWIEDIEKRGLIEVMKVKGYHDEPLKGKHKGRRSIRISRGYRALYRILDDGSVEFIEVLEVNKHEY